MKSKIAILLLACSAWACAGGESADDVAKRVMAGPYAVYTPGVTGTLTGLQEKPPLELAVGKSDEALRSYMLSKTTPEKIRIAYAITVLAAKRIPKPLTPGIFMESVYRQNLKDAQILSDRFDELEAEE